MVKAKIPTAISATEVEPSPFGRALDRFTAELHVHRTLALTASPVLSGPAVGDAQSVIQRILREFGEGSSKRHLREMRQLSAALLKASHAAENPDGRRSFRPINMRLSERTGRLLMTQLAGEVKLRSAEMAQPELLLKLCLTGAVTVFEILFGRIVRLYYDRAHGSLEKRQVSYADIWRFDSVTELREFLMETAVEEVLRLSVDDWRKFLDERIHIDLDKAGVPWSDIALIVQHRHIIVHADNIASPSYVQKSSGAKLLAEHFRGKVKAGLALPVDREYIVCALDILEIGGLLTALDTWARIAKDDKRWRIGIVSSNLAAAIARERWTVGAALAGWASRSNDLDSGGRTRFLLDAWMCRRNAGDASAVAELNAYDPSALRLDLAARYYALRGDVPRCVDALASMAKSDRLDLLNGPYFQSLRADRRLQEYRRRLIGQMRPTRKKAAQSHGVPSKP